MFASRVYDFLLPSFKENPFYLVLAMFIFISCSRSGRYDRLYINLSAPYFHCSVRNACPLDVVVTRYAAHQSVTMTIYGGSTAEVTWTYRTTSSIQVFPVLSSVRFVMLGSLAECLLAVL